MKFKGYVFLLSTQITIINPFPPEQYEMACADPAANGLTKGDFQL